MGGLHSSPSQSESQSQSKNITQSIALTTFTSTSPTSITADKNISIFEETKQHLPRSERHDIQKLSSHEMELEFQKIHERSTEILKSLSRNPCEELSMRITRCLKDNADEMSKCFSAMDDYRTCVNEQVGKQIAKQSLQ